MKVSLKGNLRVHWLNYVRYGISKAKQFFISCDVLYTCLCSNKIKYIHLELVWALSVFA